MVGGFLLDLAAKGKIQIQALAPPPPVTEVVVGKKTGRRRIEPVGGPQFYLG